MSFEPIAIVGRACLLPGAADPAALWEAVRSRRDLLSSAPPDRWGAAPADVLGSLASSIDRTWSDRGGYVRGFDARFDPAGFALPAREILGLDPLFRWLLHVGREALIDAKQRDVSRTGAVIGNLSFPSNSMTRFAERVWLGDALADAAGLPSVDPRNRFSSGLPAHLLARALGLGDVAYCLDAACASSLVAIKLACDRLHDGLADVMLAGAVNCADDLFIHVGFCALKALSASGQSRPFHPEADGLVPAEGAGIVVLQRLADAEKSGRPILGVIRGVGLSNDGRENGLLAPGEEGQIRAMQRAYAQAGLTPADMDYVECHATGTSAGDGAELRSMRRIFGDRAPLPIGSLKSNLGHLITAAGVASLLKVLAAFEAKSLPATLHLDQVERLDGLIGTPFRVLTATEAWEKQGPRRAAVSAFGFGGNNAHLIVEQYVAGEASHRRAQRPMAAVAKHEVAVVGIARQSVEPGGQIALSLEGLRFPPKDLEQTLPQQLLALATARDALEGLADLPKERLGVLIGMGCDPNVARYGARWRLPTWARRWGVRDAAWIEEARGAFVNPLEAAGVLGTMPNIVANRINSALDFGGASMSLSSEELSGVRALEVACRALVQGELDAALVGAVDLGAEPVQRAALRALDEPREAADAAVMLVLERLEDARKNGHPIIAIVAPAIPEGDRIDLPATSAHAASGLLQIAEAVLGGEEVRLELGAMEGQRAAVVIRAGDGPARAGKSATRSGPQRSFAAHAPPVQLPRLPEIGDERWVAPLTPPPDLVQNMVRAPWLEPIVAASSDQAPTPAVAARATAQAPAQGQEQAAAMGATPAAAWLTQHAAQRAHIAELHQRFLLQQAALHEQFLALRARTQQALVDAHSRRLPAARPEQAPPPPPLPPAPNQSLELPGPKLDRAGLMQHAGGQISSIFGAAFSAQDGYRRQVRMPLPPLLLADRVLGIDAEPLSMGRGTIWTETEVRADSWYLHEGRMPAGIMIESGQADLMLISYLGVDLLNKSERVYRLLGCELTYHGELPQPGDTLRYDIHVDGHANQGDIRLFFFHYDCKVAGQPRLSVRNGQAGFFTDDELAASGGILWEASSGERCDEPRLDPSPQVSQRRRFDAAQIRAFAAGDALSCFGPGFERSCAHTRTPRVAAGRMLFIDEVTSFEPKGGPWGRGYLRAVDSIEPDDWFFDGHFKNDPCMPGTLMFEGCLQAMSIYLTALGFTLDRDGWRFEPAVEERYQLRCRGQVLPSSKQLVYEVFIEEVVDGPTPTVYADLLCTVDGLKAFHCRRMALRLVPDWPLEQILENQPGLLSTREGPVADAAGFRFDHRSLLACAWGRPSQAFGRGYEVFDNHRRVARLPGPPYHFMTRVEQIDGDIGSMQVGQRVEVAYDVPSDAWYFDENGFRSMPMAVLMEAALQPCGWLASFVGSALTSDQDLCFRNLDGTGTLKKEVLPSAGTLRTRAKIVGISSSAGMIIESFEVECLLGDESVFEMTTVFGFFPAEALAKQVGMPVPESEQGALEAVSDVLIDLEERPAQYFEARPRLASPFLLMIDRVTGIWPEGGAASLGRYRAEKDVKPDEWFFKAHFFQDPVQPGSLGIEAMVQLLQFAMLHRGMGEGIEDARFEPLALGAPLTWKYRGQVLMKNARINTLVDLVEVGTDARGPYAIARASLYVDGMRIYEAKNLGMRIVPGGGSASDREEVLDPAVDSWITDHRPTYTAPALPLMSMVDRMAAAALAREPQRAVVEVNDVRVERWLPITSPTRLRTEVTQSRHHAAGQQRYDVKLLAYRCAPRAELSRFELVATASVLLGDYAKSPEPLEPLADAVAVPDPYRAGHLFHGEAFQKLSWLALGASGSSALLDAAPGRVPKGCLNQVLLDAITHAIPNDTLHRWCDEIPVDQVGYPYRIAEMKIFGPPPKAGQLRCEVRFAGFDGDFRFPSFVVQLIDAGQVWLSLRLTEILMPKGPLGDVPPLDRVAFLRDRRAVPGMALSRREDGVTRLPLHAIKASNWLPGTIESLYATEGDAALEVAAKDHVALLAGVHPSTVQIDGRHAVSAAQPLTRHELDVAVTDHEICVRSVGSPRLDLAPVRGYWDRYFDAGRWPVEDLYYGLIHRFVGAVHIADPAAFAALRGRSTLYLANHQVGIESLLFSIIASGLSGVPTVTLAKEEHRTTWLGLLIQHCFSYPGIVDPRVITYFDRGDSSALSNIVLELSREMMGPGKSVMVHIEGTRSLSCRTPVVKMTSLFIDMALATRAPIVPVRFVGGLPARPLEGRIEFPFEMGRQDLHFGRPIQPETFEALPYKERKAVVIEAINALGPNNAEEEPMSPDPAFAACVSERARRTGASAEHAALFEMLAELSAPGDEVQALLRGARQGRLSLPATPVGVWLAELARRLYGPAGGEVIIE